MSVWAKTLQGMVLFVMLLGCSATGQAAAAAVPSASELVLTASLASLASYNDELNLLVRSYMSQAGWQIRSFEHDAGRAEGRLHLFSRPQAYLLAFPGTERKADAIVDLQIRRVPFGGRTVEEFAQVASGEADGTKPLVHQGFDVYTRAALFTEKLADRQNMTLGEVIAAHLRAHPEHVLYLTGHSLGGAAATLAAARLADMGVPARQLQVITFGAPAVGNEAFAQAYAPRMQLTRYAMDFDPVHTVLQSVNRGFVQFGQRVAWQKDAKTDRFPHDMTGYLDQALRHYYADDQRTSLLLAGTPERTGGILTAPVAFSLPRDLQVDQHDMQLVVHDALTRAYADVQSAESDSLPQLTAQAGRMGCAYILQQHYTAARLRQSKEVQYRITLEETLHDQAGNVLTLQQLSTTTHSMTPLEAVVYLQEQAKEQRHNFLQP